MRNIFIRALIEKAEKNPNLYVLTGDLGFRTFEDFRDKFPSRFLNVGAAEANMIGVAAGIALSGKKTVCAYSIAPFIAFRALEQIRNDICHQNLNVKLIASGGGFSYGNQGCSHNTTEDLAVMRSLPNMFVLNPADQIEAELSCRAALCSTGPVYLRLGKAGEKKIYNELPHFDGNNCLLVKPGNDLTLASTGNILETVVSVAELLEKEGISTRILSFPCLKPFDKETVKKAAKETNAIFSIEEHGPVGGLADAITEALMDSGLGNIKFKRFALTDKSYLDIGCQAYLRKLNGLDIAAIYAEILKICRY